MRTLFCLHLLLIIWVAACINIDINLPGDNQPAVKIKDAEFRVEVADTPLLRERGLSGRRYLEEREGMLYIPDGADAGPFWMKEMLFSLDFIWIDGECRVVDINPYARVPEAGTPDDRLRRYYPYPSATYTLEVNAGEAERFGIEVGDKVELENIDDHC